MPFAKIEGQSLFEWVPDANNALSALMRAIKGRAPMEWLEDLAEIFLSEVEFSESLQNPILVSAPSSKRSAQDQAFRWAKMISTKTGIPLQRPLRKKAARDQKTLSRSQRLKFQVEFFENFTGVEFVHRDVIFVDDVVTTGATAGLSMNQLQCQSFQVWSLAQRTRSLL